MGMRKLFFAVQGAKNNFRSLKIFTFPVKVTGIGIPKDQHDIKLEAFEQLVGQCMEKDNMSETSETEKNMAKSDSPLGTVLVVDDTPDNLGVIAAYLKECSFKTLVASNGEIALQRAKYSQPDIILLDVMMPGIDGFETCRRLKADEDTKNIPVIFMTALSDLAHKKRGFSEGGVDYITKPVQYEEVLARVSTHLKTQRYREHLEEEVHQRTTELKNRTSELEDANKQLNKEILERKRAEDELRKHRDHLEEQVKKRTRDLEEINRELEEKSETLEHQKTELENKNLEIRTSREEIERKVKALENSQNRLQKAKEEAEAANRAKTEFLANMSHEIRTPMNSILGFAELLSEQITDPKQQKYLSYVQSAGKLLLVLIDDILDLSRIEAGKLNIVNKLFNPQSFFMEMKTFFSPGISEKNLDFIYEVDNNLPSLVLLDETRLRQVLFNLIGNAVKFTDSGYVMLSVLCRYTCKDHSKFDMGFFVEDTGIGIPEDQRERIFNMFEQGKEFSHAKYGGTGLGLAITKRLVESMGGSIHLEGEQGKGSRFTVSIPNVSVALASDNISTEDSLVPGSLVFEEASVLIIDDMKSNRDLVREMLEKYDFTFSEASDGKTGVELAKNAKPDIIFMDMKMPEMGGAEATAKIREDKALANIPVIAFTASSMKQDEDEIRGFCDGFLRKPVNKKELIREMMRFIPCSPAQTNPQKPDEETKTAGHLPEFPHVPEHCEDVFDRKTALEQMDGDEELLEKYIQICLEDISEELGKLEQALEIRKTESVKIHAHTIKGMAGTMGANELRNTALDIEKTGNDYDLDMTRRLFKRFRQEYDRFLSVYEKVKG